MPIPCKTCCLLLPEAEFVRLPEVKARRGYSSSCRRCLLERQVRDTKRKLEDKRRAIAAIDYSRRQAMQRHREALRACGD